MEKHTVSRLLGAPPGYVGYEEGGQLTEKVRRRPYSVVLLDEFEKAHPEVFSILLQVFDEGRLTDSWGHVVDFRNSVVILTSNLGTRKIKKDGGLGFHSRGDVFDYESMKEKVLNDVKRTFSPEFLNRLDEIIVFKPLTEDDIACIVDIMIGKLNLRIADKAISIALTEEVRDFLVKHGYDPEYGARPLRRTIQKYIEDPLSIELIEGKIQTGSEVEVYMENNKVAFRPLERDRMVVKSST